MKILAVDLGDARTGLAVCARDELMAEPAGVIATKSYAETLQKTAQAAAEHKAELVVVGHPKNMNGTVGDRAKKCEDFAEKLGALTGLPVVLWDERGTTVTAIHYLNETNTRGKKRKGVVDAVAATIILEGYLSYRKNQMQREAQKRGD